MRVRLLEKILIMLSCVENEIRFLCTPADSIIDELAQKDELKPLLFLAECSAGMKNGENFAGAWSKAITQKENVRGLTKSDVGILSSFGGIFGTTDALGQVSNCRVHTELVKENLAQARSERDKYSPLSDGMGFVLGVGVIIIFI